jgi:polar amino acid transport system substrate-binding protein
VKLRALPVVLAIVACAMSAAPAAAAPYEQVKRTGSLSVCANPDALPYSSRQSGPPGFQVELAQAVAREMGLGLAVNWVWERRSARKVDCDALMDSIVLDSVLYEHEGQTGPAVQSSIGGLRYTKPYASSGVVLVVPADSPARRFEDLPGAKIGVIVGSVVHQMLAQKGLKVSVFAFQDEIVAAVDRGEIGAGAVAPPYVGWYVHQHPGAKVRVPEGYQAERELSWNVAIGLRRADDALVDAVNAALDRLMAARAIADIYAKYGVAYQPPLAPRAAAR